MRTSKRQLQAERRFELRAFTLVELLVVIVIIAVLIAILLPTLSGVRRRWNNVSCISNMRQICLALHMYATNNHGSLPINITFPAPGRYWCDAGQINVYLPQRITGVSGKCGGPVYACPSEEGALRSYSMNAFASSRTGGDVLTSPPVGTLFKPTAKRSSELILLVENWTWWGDKYIGWCTPPIVGYNSLTPGQRFGGGGGLSPVPTYGRFGLVNSEVCYFHHRSNNIRAPIQTPIGSTNIGFLDSHVASFRETDLVSMSDGTLKNTAFWSPMDYNNN